MRDQVKAILEKFNNEEIKDHMVALYLSETLAFNSVYDTDLNEEDLNMLKKAYRQLKEEGYLEE